MELSAAEGRIAAVNAGLFPPCCPLIVAGDKVDKTVIRSLTENKNVFGTNCGKIAVLKQKG